MLADFVAYLEAPARDGHHPAGPGMGHAPGTDAHPLVAGQAGCAWCAASPATCEPSTRPPRCLLPSLMGWQACRAVPYLYSEPDIAALMAAAAVARARAAAATYQTLVGLLGGHRACGSGRSSASTATTSTGTTAWWSSGTRKFGKSREVPLHPSTPRRAAPTTPRLRDRLCPRPTTSSFFVSPGGRRLVYETVQQDFPSLVRARRPRARVGQLPAPAARLPAPPGRAPPCSAGIATGVDVQAQLPLLSTWLGHAKPENSYWYLSAVPELLALAAERRDQRHGGAVMSALAPTLESLFTERLIGQRHASPNTVAAYRDTWRLLLGFVQSPHRQATQPARHRRPRRRLIGEFLDHLEQERHNSVRTRNARLAAIRSFFRYAALRHPEHAGLIARVLAIPTKRCERRPRSAT